MQTLIDCLQEIKSGKKQKTTMSNPCREREYQREAEEIAFQLCDRFARLTESMKHDQSLAWAELIEAARIRFDEAIQLEN
jgi:hypothetical protein